METCVVLDVLGRSQTLIHPTPLPKLDQIFTLLSPMLKLALINRKGHNLTVSYLVVKKPNFQRQTKFLPV